MKRAVLYLRVSTLDQTTANQERELRQVAERAGWEIVRVYKDHGISGAKAKDKRPQFDALHKAATRREFDVVIMRFCRVWSWRRSASASLRLGFPRSIVAHYEAPECLRRSLRSGQRRD
jgi:DNA invertase Pin-like site-specific DNA recombinase